MVIVAIQERLFWNTLEHLDMSVSKSHVSALDDVFIIPIIKLCYTIRADVRSLLLSFF